MNLRIKKHWWGPVAILIFAILVILPPRGSAPCERTPEGCPSGFVPPVMRDWNVPTEPWAKEAHDYAHSLPIPSIAPEPVPFDFDAAKESMRHGGPSIASRYFKHLCDTEAGEYIVRTVPNVEGFLILRPRPRIEGTPEDLDLFAPEEPTGHGWFADDDTLKQAGRTYVQPLYGIYRFVEVVVPGKSGRVLRFGRKPIPLKPNLIYSDWGSMGAATADYAYTWFNITSLRPRWSAAVDCDQEERLVRSNAPYFIAKVLQPDLHVNDEFVPTDAADDYHQTLLEMTGQENAN